MDKLKMLSHNNKKWCIILPLHRRGASDNEVGDYCDYGDYEDVGTPVVPTRVSFLHLQSLQIVSFYSSLIVPLSVPRREWDQGQHNLPACSCVSPVWNYYSKSKSHPLVMHRTAFHLFNIADGLAER